MNLICDIAITHLRGRLRQTTVAIAGVATGVGFAIAMAALMEGSQRNFVETLVDAEARQQEQALGHGQGLVAVVVQHLGQRLDRSG